jgi:4-hydroxy-tetrahydrodipicolinate reductase
MSWPAEVARVSIYGAGQLGSGVASLLRQRGEHAVDGPFGRDERERALGSGADVVLIATTTRLADVVDDIRRAVRAGSNVLVSAEETANPYLVDPALAAEVHDGAVAAGVTVLGAGLNPGLVFDALVLTVLGAAADDVDVSVSRTVDISGFGTPVLRRIGVGLTPTEFDEGVRAGEVLGHAGFPQSISIVGRARGIAVPSIEPSLAAVVTSEPLTLRDGREIAAGRTAGVDQTYRATRDGRTWYEARFRGHVDPASVGWALADVITLTRDGEVVQELTARPCFPAQSGSQHVLANSIDRVLAARPGWLNVADLPPAAWSGSAAS